MCGAPLTGKTELHRRVPRGDEQEKKVEHLNPAHERVGGDDGLSHHGDPEEEEVIVPKEPEEEVSKCQTTCAEST